LSSELNFKYKEEMVFSEDSYNKRLPQEGQSRVLIGNWYEESILQETVGEARSVPQRHIKRSGLLKDFTKRPAEVRKLDDTFERVCGSATVGGTLTTPTTFEKIVVKEARLGPRRALEEAAFLKKATSRQEKKPSDQARFVTQNKGANTMETAKPEVDPRQLKWVGKYTEFSHPIELQRRGGRFKDQSGIRPSVI
jgi:hypothetical protein